MPEEIVMVSTCPLCGGPEEVLSMVTVEIDRIIPRGRTAIVICRICVGAVIRAGERVEPELAERSLWFERLKAKAPWSSDTWSAVAEIYGAFGDDPAWLKEQSAAEKEERYNDPPTD